MVNERLKLELEVQEIFKSIDQGRNFLLSGGAGSGKTYSLVNVIRQTIAENPTKMVACMTYTNAAVKEIEERVNHKNLNVSTIHDFLWENIKHFQKELKKTIISLVNNEEFPKISIDGVNPVPEDYYDNLEEGIQYKEYLKLSSGIISHDELLLIANYLFGNYSMLSRIVKDKYKFIFIDEYQDTNKLVVEIFLSHFKKSKGNSIIGFFGDSMQSIYDSGIGDLDEYKGDALDTVKEIKKEQNRRNPQKIISLANILRTDGIEQIPSTDENAPNMHGGVVKQGTVLFLYSSNDDVNRVKGYLSEKYGWDFENSKETKELNLTHNLIADKAGFRALMDIYDSDPILALKEDILKRNKNNPEIIINTEDTFDVVVDKFKLENRAKKLKKDILLVDPITAALYNQLKDNLFSDVRKIYINKDALIDDKKEDEGDENKNGSKRDGIIKHLFKIQNIISLYTNKKYNEFLKVTDYRFRMKNIASKKELKENIDQLINVKDKKIELVINDAHEKGICLIDDKLIAFRQKNSYLYNRVKEVQFSEFQMLYKYLEGKTPFSTQHKTKGAEFDNVFVILDNGKWNKYNFSYLFKEEGTESVLQRTQKIFYVCCTRAKENLAVFFYKPEDLVISKAKQWFGEDNVVDIN